MEYRKLPHGNEKIGVLGLGMGGIQNTKPEEIQAVIEKAIENGINFLIYVLVEKVFMNPSDEQLPKIVKRYISNCTLGLHIKKMENMDGLVI